MKIHSWTYDFNLFEYSPWIEWFTRTLLLLEFAYDIDEVVIMLLKRIEYVDHRFELLALDRVFKTARWFVPMASLAAMLFASVR